MSGPYTPTATRHATITVIDDNDEPSGSLFSTPLEQLADNIAVQEVFAFAKTAGATSASGGALTLDTLVFDSGGFVHSALNETLTVPAPGTYLVRFECTVKSSSTASTVSFIAELKQSSSGLGFNVIASAKTVRYSATAADYVHLSGEAVVVVTAAPGTDDAGLDDDGTFLVALTASGTITPDSYTLAIRRIR